MMTVSCIAAFPAPVTPILFSVTLLFWLIGVQHGKWVLMLPKLSLLVSARSKRHVLSFSVNPTTIFNFTLTSTWVSHSSFTEDLTWKAHIKKVIKNYREYLAYFEGIVPSTI